MYCVSVDGWGIIRNMDSQLQVLANGAVYDHSVKRIVNSKNVTTKITQSNAVDYLSARERKREKLIRAQLSRRTSGARDGYDAVAIASGDLWEQVVLNDKEDAEKRRKMWLSVGKQAGVLSEGVQTSDKTGSSVTLAGGDVSKLLDVISQVIGARQDTR